MRQPPISPRPLSPAARPPGTLLLSRHQPADDLSIRTSAAQRAAAFPRSVGLIASNGCRFRIPRAEAEKQGKPGEATMMPPSPPIPPVPPSAGTH